MMRRRPGLIRFTCLAATASLAATSPARPDQPEPPPDSTGQPGPASPTPPAGAPPDTRSDPVFNSEGVDQLTLEMLQRRAAPPPVSPVVPRVRVVIPPDIGQATNPFIGLDAGGLGEARAELLPEGAFLVRRRGSIIKSPAGDIVFLAHPDAQGAAERAMVVLPSPGLTQIERQLEELGPRAVCYLTGQVFQYRWQNYILPTAVNLTAADDLVPAQPDPALGASAPEQPGGTAESVIRDLESRRGRPRSISRPAAPALDADAAHSTLAEPELLTERRARIIRLPDGRLAVAFDRGFSPGTEATMPLLECAGLQRLEAQPLGNEPVFSITGRALPYQGRVYFLLSGFHTATVSDVSSLQ